jgi:FkbM family methyltransferase
MKEELKRLIQGTRVEPPARWVWTQLRRSGIVRVPLLPEDRWTIAIMERVLRIDSCCVDVGCCVGSILTHMVRLAPRGRHLAFEPLPPLAADLKRSFPGVEVFEAALADFEGDSTFQYVVTNPGYSGLRRREYPRPDETIETLRVRVERLDHLLPDPQRVDFIKIDVEGAVLQVLRGAERILRTQHPYVIFEHGKGSSEYYGTTSEQVYEFLVDGCGLRISLLPDWLKQKPPLDRDGFVAQWGGSTWYFVAHPPRT